MVAIRIPGTGKIIFVSENNGDIVLNLDSYNDIDDSVSREDVRIVGDWSDFSGSGEKPGGEVMMQGISDVDPGTPRGQLEGGDLNLTDTGHRASKTRQRPVLLHLDLKCISCLD